MARLLRHWACRAAAGAPAVRALARVAVLALGLAALPTAVAAETLRQVLAEVFARNPTVNAARQGVRATRETITQAEAGRKPTVNALGDYGYRREIVDPTGNVGGALSRNPRSAALAISQPIFDGFKANNTIRQAEAIHAGAIDGLRNTTQNTLQDAVQAYVDIVRDLAIADLRRKDVGVLTEQVRVVRAQLAAGDLRPSDVAQTESRQSASRAALSLAEANLRASRANFLRVVGRMPGSLAEPEAVDRRAPGSLRDVLQSAEGTHPALLAARSLVDAASTQVEINRAELYPKVSVDALLQHQREPDNDKNKDRQAAVIGRVTVPLYDGGLSRSKVREALEILEQRRFELDAVRAQIEAAATIAWGTLISARAQIEASGAQIRAADAALQAVQAEARGGLRTQLETLNAQKELLDARVALATAKHDRVLASYALLAAAGLLDPVETRVDAESRRHPAAHGATKH